MEWYEAPSVAWMSLLTCKLAISERPARRQTMLAGGLASATQRSTSASLSSSKSISGEPIRRMVGASAKHKMNKLTKQNKHKKHETRNKSTRQHGNDQAQDQAVVPTIVLFFLSGLNS